MPCFVLLVLFVAAAKILSVKAGTFFDPACLPCLPACLVLVQYFAPATGSSVEVVLFANSYA